MRTGATEIKDKLPVHFNTTFRCYPDKLIFSDYEETFQGHQVHDVLVDVDEGLKQTNDDFQHYQHLQRLGREGLQADELHGESWESGPTGKNDNPGWRLDKWKFLPMIVQTLKLRPEKKWYIFVEPDSYIVWSNMVQWLEKLDPNQELYYGSEVQIGDDIFAHGGTGFVMSKSAMEKGAEIYINNPDEWHERTAGHWAGDCILGTALTKAGVDLTWSWPMFQGGNPSDLRWSETKAERRLWCEPAMSFHHFSSYEIQAMWGFEQQRIQRMLTNEGTKSFWRTKDSILHYHEMFREYVMPNITAERNRWSNLSPDVVFDSKRISLSDCRAHCEARDNCVQYNLGPLGCSLSTEFKMGQLRFDVSSGWITERVNALVEDMGTCTGQSKWTVT